MEISSQSKNIKKNCSVVFKLLGNLEEPGHIEKVNFKPLAIFLLNLVPKSNSSPGLIHNLKALNRFVKRGPSVKHLNVRELAKSEFSRKTYFCKLDLSNGYLHLISECLFFKHLILVSHWKAHSTRSLSYIYI